MLFINAVLSLLVAGASAMPAHQQKRTAGAVYFCTGTNFTGSCLYQANSVNTCNDLPSNYSMAVSSFGPDKGAECLLMQGHCNANQQYYSITYPGYGDLSTISQDNLATSYICFEESATPATRSRVLSSVV